MSDYLEFCDRTASQGINRGRYTWPLKDFYQLQENNVLQGSKWSIGNFEWKLMLTLKRRGHCRTEKLEISLWSCNSRSVKAYVGISLNQNETDVPRRLRSAVPFGKIEQCCLTFRKMPDSLKARLFSGELSLTITLKDIETYPDERQKCANDKGAIGLEIINRRSIQQVLNGRVQCGIVSPEKKRDDTVHEDSSVHLWSEHNRDCRRWSAERSESSGIMIKKCLNNFSPFLIFKELCNGKNDRMITLFEEEEALDEALQPVDEDKIVVFCKRSDPQDDDPSYVGYYISKKTMSSQDLLDKLAEMAGLSDENYRSYLDQGCLPARDISGEDGSLDQCGIQSGSCITLRKSDLDEGALLPDDVIQRMTNHVSQQTAAVNSEHDSLDELNSSSAINFVFDNPLFSS